MLLIINRYKAEKLRNEGDALTPLHAHNSLLIRPGSKFNVSIKTESVLSMHGSQPPKHNSLTFAKILGRPSLDRTSSRDGLIASAAEMGRRDERSLPTETPSWDREPRLPDVGFELRDLH